MTFPAAAEIFRCLIALKCFNFFMMVPLLPLLLFMLPAVAHF